MGFKARLRLSLILQVLLALPLLSGCLVATRTSRQVKMPDVVRTANADQLVKAINDRCSAIQSLSAVVDYQLTEGGPRKGKEKTYTSFSGYILERKPESLRVIVQLPVVRSLALDMATNGGTFKLWIPPHNEVFEGSNTVTKVSSNPLENFRPKIFTDSLSVRCISPEELVTLSSEERKQLDPKANHLLTQADYDLNVLSLKKNSQVLILARVIHFSRSDLQPYQEDIYDEKGAIQTEAFYGPMQTFDAAEFPKTITIKCPLEELQIEITIQKLLVNPPLTDDKFELKIPSDTKIHELN